jgi:cyanophycin synthetase
MEAGVPVPEGDTVTTVDDALRVARKLARAGHPEAARRQPGQGRHGRCRTPDEVEQAYAFARKYGRRIIVERFVEGRDYRVLVAGGRSPRRPAAVRPT